MKFKCYTSVLREACNGVARACSSKTSIPSLSGVKFTSSSQKLILTGYNLELGIMTEIPAEIEEDGEISIAASVICEILKTLPDEKVLFEINERYLCHIESGVSVFDVNAMPADDYPELPYVSGEDNICLCQNILRDMVRQSVFAVSPDDARVALRGLKFELSEGLIRTVAVDGYRVAIRNEEIDYHGENIEFIVPGKSINEIIKFADKEDVPVYLTPDRQYISFSLNGYKIVSRLIEGDFLDYKRALPKETVTSVKVNCRELLFKLTGMSFLTDERNKFPVRCKFENGNLRINLSSSNGVGDTMIKISQDGPDVEIGFNISYLIEALRSSECDEVIIRLGTSYTPAAIVPLEGESFYYLIVPVRFR